MVADGPSPSTLAACKVCKMASPSFLVMTNDFFLLNFVSDSMSLWPDDCVSNGVSGPISNLETFFIFELPSNYLRPSMFQVLTHRYLKRKFNILKETKTPVIVPDLMRSLFAVGWRC